MGKSRTYRKRGGATQAEISNIDELLRLLGNDEKYKELKNALENYKIDKVKNKYIVQLIDTILDDKAISNDLNLALEEVRNIFIININKTGGYKRKSRKRKSRRGGGKNNPV